jgi:hypothetical protein
VWAKHPSLGLSLISFCPQAEIGFMQREKNQSCQNHQALADCGFS